MFSRNALKLGLLACCVILLVTILVSNIGGAFSLLENDALYFLETGSGISAVAIFVALIATA